MGALYPDRHATEIDHLIMCGEGESLKVARAILTAGGRTDLSRTIRPRHSKTTSSTYLSNGCQHCDAIQGAFYVDDAVFDVVTSTGAFKLDGLVTLLVGPCPSETWQRFFLGEET